MEEIEEANKAAVGSCHGLLSLLSQQQQQQDQNHHHFRTTLMVETGQVVLKFKKVVSLLNSTSFGNHGSGRVRLQRRKFQSPLPQHIFLDNPNSITSAKPLQIIKTLEPNPNLELGSTTKSSNSLQLSQNMFLDKSAALEMSSISMSSHQILPSTVAHYQFFQQHQQQLQHQQRLQQQQQQQQQKMKFEAEMYRKGGSGMHVQFDSPSCTPTMSSNRSFISSLSMDASVASLDRKQFHFNGIPQSSGNSQHNPKRRCSGRGEDGSVKCGSSGRCHCSKRRKLRVKRSIKVPAISNKIADIPPDEYSWRKYGQKPIKGSPHPSCSVCSNESRISIVKYQSETDSLRHSFCV
ncbi:hypothetical protein MKW94_007958 [Papaver nudicaule]|uniref:WRKY domain-containing protein n=1 Tax=Papaver nudicaule TaxID=74823 RepID=A0AA41VA32_PAPNU|nr:hypothetical protein [Papaver nudicaule]